MQLLVAADDRLAAVIPADQAPLVNIGCGEDVTIRELAELARQVVGCSAGIHWDHGKPDGTPRKLLDVSRIKALGWRPTVGLEEGIRLAYADFASRPR